MTTDPRPEPDAADVEDALRGLAEALSCSQCGRPFSHRACGLTHAIIASDPRRHRLIAPLLAQVRADARRQAGDYVAKAIEGKYLGADFCRNYDGSESPDAALAHAYDEGLEEAARIAREVTR